MGGKARVEMSKLKKCFEQLGFDDVSTYINSGNVIFSSDLSEAQLITTIQKSLAATFKFDLRVVVRSFDQIKKVVDTVPSRWTNDYQQKTDVMFLWPEIDKPNIVRSVAHKPEIENILYVAGALVWNIGRRNVTRGGGVKLIKTDLYKHMTVRNINTVRKLYTLMSQMSEQSSTQ